MAPRRSKDKMRSSSALLPIIVTQLVVLLKDQDGSRGGPLVEAASPFLGYHPTYQQQQYYAPPLLHQASGAPDVEQHHQHQHVQQVGEVEQDQDEDGTTHMNNTPSMLNLKPKNFTMITKKRRDFLSRKKLHFLSR